MPKKVLVVSDNKTTAECLCDALREKYDLLTAENVNAALCCIEQNRALLFCVLCDYSLSETLLLSLYREQLGLQLPVLVVMNEYDEQAARTRSLVLGACDYIAAPLIPEKILQKLTDCPAKFASVAAAATQRLKAVLDNVGSGITAVTYQDDSLQILLTNDRFFELLGTTRERFAQASYIFPLHDEDCEWVERVSKEAYAERKDVTIEFRAHKSDGSTIWLRDCMTMTSFAETELAVQLNILTDITSERQSATVLLDNLPGGAALIEYEGSEFNIVHINKRFWQLVARSPMECVGKPMLLAFHPDDRERVRAEFLNAIEKGTVISCDIRLRCTKETYRPFRMEGRAIKQPNGSYLLSTLYSPISEQALSMSKMLPIALAGVMDKSSDVAYVMGSDRRFVSCSESFAQLCGMGAALDVIGRNVFDFFPKDLALQHDEVDSEIFNSGDSIVNAEVSVYLADGMRRMSFSKYPLFDSAGVVAGILGMGHDVTEANENKTRLELLTNSIPGGIAFYESDTDRAEAIRLVYFSDGFCRLLGYTREEYAELAKGNPLSHVLPADIPTIYEHIKQTSNTGAPIDVTFRVSTKDGSVKWINERAVLGGQNDSRLTVNAVFFDVTEQMEAIEAMRMSAEVSSLAISMCKNAICRYDVNTSELFVSPNASSYFNFKSVEADVPQSQLRDGKISPETMQAYADFYDAIRRGVPSGQVRFQRLSSIGWRWIEANYMSIFSDSGKPRIAVLSCIDMTDSLERDAAYAKWQRSFSDRAPESYSLFRCNITKNTILSASEGGLRLKNDEPLYETNFELRTESYANSLHKDDREKYLAFMSRKQLLQRMQIGRSTSALEYREKNGAGYRWLRVSVDLMESFFSGDLEANILFEDIDEAKRAELAIIERAETDALTGVYNRVTFEMRVNERLRSASPDETHALLMLDIDGFKLVNDVFGHAAGDQALIEVAEMLRKTSAARDIVGRLGGDEFVLFMQGASIEAVETRAAQLCARTRKTYSVQVSVSCSIGISFAPRDGTNFETLYKKADDTLYYVKGTGKNKYAFYSEDRKRAEPAEENSLTVAYEETVQLHTRPRLMLIVDDSPLDFEMLANLFSADFKVEKALDGASALIKLHHYGSAIAIVLLDLMMPGMDGFAVLEKMQQSADTKGIPVIVVSGDNNRETSLRVIRAGASDLVTKPVDPDILRIRVLSAIARADNERLRAQNSFLALQSSEINSYKTVLERTKTVVVVNNWSNSSFTYSPSIKSQFFGNYDLRSFWQILLSDLVADSQTVQSMQQLAHAIANDRGRMDGSLSVPLKAADGKKRQFEMTIFKQVNEYGLCDKLIMTFREKLE